MQFLPDLRCWHRMPGWMAMGGVLLALVGCAAIATPETQISTGRLRFESAIIRYRCEPAAVPPPATPASGVQLAAFIQPAAPSAGASGLTRLLQIQYPHPAGRVGYARVELILGSVSAPSDGGWPARFRRALRDSMPGMGYADGIAEAWALDVPVGEIDRILLRLEEQDYFTSGSSAPTGTLLAAKIDGVEFERPWQRSDEFEALSLRVRRDGKLVSHRQPLEPVPVAAVGTRTGATAALAVTPAVVFLERLPAVEPTPGR